MTSDSAIYETILVEQREHLRDTWIALIQRDLYPDAKTLEPEHVGGPVDLVVVDASFIGLGKLLPACARVLRPDGQLVALVKPQFEAGREEVSRGRGVIRDPEVRARAIEGVVVELGDAGFDVLGQCDSTLPGPKGNLEAFVHARKRAR